jgi:glycyl-tRNA synthetase
MVSSAGRPPTMMNPIMSSVKAIPPAYDPVVLTMQDALLALTRYWTDHGCLAVQPMNTEVGAGTLNPATFLRVLGPEPWRVCYVEPSVRPDDARYGENPNRIQTHTQFQVILKPEPGDPQQLYLGSLRALGVHLEAHDVRFVEDNWASPALGAWGLGWEVWLDGLEITQFTYFQQAGGISLDPPSVELTYGMERIMMALQGVRHFKDVTYAAGISYGEVFGQAEYEMSRYYLDDADLATNQALFDAYESEAQRMIDARLPVPAHVYVLKCSHAFNVLDARGAVSTTERAKAFARMRGLARDVALLWVERRREDGFPLGAAGSGVNVGAAPDRGVAGSGVNVGVALDRDGVGAVGSGSAGAGRGEVDSVRESAVGPVVTAPGVVAPLVFEIGVEELPPHEVGRTADAVRQALAERLAATRLTHGELRVFATPRRVVALVDDVEPREDDSERFVRGPKAQAAFGPDGAPTKAATGFARGQGVDVSALERVEVDGVAYVGVTKHVAGRTATDVFAEILPAIVSGLRAEKNMRWSAPGLSFARPMRWTLALLGDAVVPFTVSSLTSGRTTSVHRTAPQPQVPVPSAGRFLDVLAEHGIVADAAERRRQILAAASTLSAEVGGTVDPRAETALLDEITNLVEQPNALRGDFDPAYLDLPADILTTVMRKHQRYLPVRAADGSLLPHFVVVANGGCDPDVVRAGNEAVLRARYEDAAFFWRADLESRPEDLKRRLTKLTFADRLGSMSDRATRIATIAEDLADLVPAAASVRLADETVATLRRAAALAKFDLASHMVIELSSLAGVMAREYAVRAGEPEAVATALYEMELPRTAGGTLPETVPGALLALADRVDLLTGLFAVGAAPTGSSDPYAMRRAALGIVAILRATDGRSGVGGAGGSGPVGDERSGIGAGRTGQSGTAVDGQRGVGEGQAGRSGIPHPALAGITISAALRIAAATQPVEVSPQALADAKAFIAGRLEQQLLDTGHPYAHVQAVLGLADRPASVDRALADLAKRAHEGAFRALVEAIQRIHRIVPAGTQPDYDPALLTEPAERALHAALTNVSTALASSDVFGPASPERAGEAVSGGAVSGEAVSGGAVSGEAVPGEAVSGGAVRASAASVPVGAGLDLASFGDRAAVLVEPITVFFDDILVMAEDQVVRANRLGLLAAIQHLAGTVGIRWELLA